MKKQLILSLVVCALAAHAAYATETSNDAVKPGKPVAWQYRSLLAGLDVFESRNDTLAPAATLHFKLPKGMLTADDSTTVEIALKEGPIALPVNSSHGFTLVRDARAAAEKAEVLVNRTFRPEEYRHPNVEVRTPGLPSHVLRLGDLRLGCEVQIAVAKKDFVSVRAILGVMRMFSADVCKSDMNITNDAPGVYDSVTLTAGEGDAAKTRTKQTSNFLAPLGDASWPDATLLQFTLEGQPAKP
jgi:hypothetical protein